MKFTFLTVLAAVLFALPAFGQEPPKPAPGGSDPESRPASQPTSQPTSRPTPNHDPKAKALFDKMVATIYRPRAAGLKDIRCKLMISLKSKTGESQDMGPITLEWASDKTRVTDDKTGQPFRLGADAILDLVGYEPAAEAARCHLEMLGQNQVIMRIPAWIEKRPFDCHRFTLDSENRPLSDEIIGLDGKILMTTLFGYDPDAQAPYLVMSRTRAQGSNEIVALYEYTKVGEFQLLEKTITRLANGNVTVLSYSGFEINTGLKIE